jgi:hypothetical protein
MNQNIFIFVQENQLTNYSKERGDIISVISLYISVCYTKEEEIEEESIFLHI